MLIFSRSLFTVSDMELTQLQHDSLTDLSHSERDLLLRLVRAIHAMKYGSVTLTVHDGKLVEIHKTERIRVHK